MERQIKKLIELGDVLQYEQPTKYLVSSTNYNDDYETPVLTAGKSFVLGYTNEKKGIFPQEKLPVIIFDDFTTASKFVDFPFKVKSSALKILHVDKNRANIKFLFYFMQRTAFPVRRHKRFWISEYSKIKIPLPPLTEQKRITDKIDKLFAEVGRGVELTRETKKQSGFILNSFVKKISSGNKWRQIKLGDFFDIYQPKTISTSQLVPNGKYKVYGANGVIGFYDKYNHEDSEVLMTCRGATCGSINISEPKSWINGNAMVIKPKTNKIDKLFTAYVLRIIDKTSAITGAAQPQITRKSLSPLTIPVPFSEDEPSFKMQKEMVLRFQQIEGLAKNLKQKTEEQLLQFNFLRQSTLNRAFVGKL